ncbi:MFS transporter [Aquiluna sp. KACHI24]|uniref:MFS transporter n=1 Tax=Aquiluna sp. KACHI24 TaxID=2968831 RepID=UPI0022312C24|nr:MFS transporter [Aquiluna sp. KACHI24]
MQLLKGRGKLQASSRLTLRLGITQIIGWGSGFYLPAILAVPISKSIGVSTETFFWAFTVSLLVSGLVGPRIGRLIDMYGGRKVLPWGNLAFFLGLVLLALSTNELMLFIAWAVIGVGGSMSNYDSAFATAVAFFKENSNRVIAGITVFAGFSSTISWPLTSFINSEFGWQTAVLFWAAMHLFISLPLHATIPRSEQREIDTMTGPVQKIIKRGLKFDKLLIVFALMFALEGFIVSSVNTTLPFLLTELGASEQLALLAAVILGPSQVFARILLVALGKKTGPITVAAISIAAHPLGVILILLFGVNGLLGFVILHGIGVGLNPFIRGSLPLLFFGAQSYGQRQGYVMMLSKIIGALSPTLLTLMVLADPKAAIITTLTMGLGAGVLLIWVAALAKAKGISAN